MESPVTIVKSNLTLGKILAGAIVFIAVAAIFDLAGISNWLLFPVTTARAKFARK